MKDERINYYVIVKNFHELSITFANIFQRMYRILLQDF